MSVPPPRSINWRTIDPIAAERFVYDSVRWERQHMDRKRSPLSVTDDELREWIAFSNAYIPRGPTPASGRWAIIELMSVLHRALDHRDLLSPLEVVVVMRNVIVTAQEQEDAGRINQYDAERGKLLHVLGRLVVELVDRDVDTKPEPWQRALTDLIDDQ